MKQSSNHPKTTMKIIVDTNLFLSVYLFQGKMVQAIFELVLNDKLEMIVSPILKTEVSKKLTYYGATKQLHDKVMHFIESKSTVLEPTIKIEKSRDVKDNFLLELAETAQVDFLVTRDKDLLVLGE